MKNNSVLSIDQMSQIRKLGIDTSKASMCWVKSPEGEYRLHIHDEYCYEANFMEPAPTFTLQDILEMMPKEIEGRFLTLCYDYGGYHIEYSYYYDPMNESQHKGKSFLEAAYNTLCWLAESGYLGKEDEG